MAKYFTDQEFACKCCGENKINPKLVERLDQLRELWGAPIYVSCGYRCKTHNCACGGVENSQHVLGNAADVYVDGEKDEYERFYQLVLGSRLFDGIGHYPTQLFVHVDIRSSGKELNEYRWEG